MVSDLDLKFSHDFPFQMVSNISGKIQIIVVINLVNVYRLHSISITRSPMNMCRKSHCFTLADVCVDVGTTKDVIDHFMAKVNLGSHFIDMLITNL